MSDTHLLTTSIIRMAGASEPSGYVRLVSRRDRRVLATWSIPESRYRPYDINPRGGLRGARGIGSDGERLVIALADRLLVLDRSWRQIGELTHPMFGEVHDILVERDGVWVTACSSDMLMKLGWDGAVLRSWDWRQDSALAQALDLVGVAQPDAGIDYRDPRQLPALHDFVHLNSVCRTSSGLLVSLGFVMARDAQRLQEAVGAPGAFPKQGGPDTGAAHPSQELFGVRFLSSRFVPARWVGVLLPEQGPARILIEDRQVRVPNHNLVQQGRTLVYNDSNRGHLVQQAIDGAWRKQIRIPGRPSFVRGLAALGDERFAVGNQGPAALYEADLRSMHVERICELSTHPNESVYGIHAVPETFSEPPARLWG